MNHLPSFRPLAFTCAAALLATALSAGAVPPGKGGTGIEAPPNRSAALSRFRNSAAYREFLKKTRAGADAAARYARSEPIGNGEKCIVKNDMSPMGQLAVRSAAAAHARVALSGDYDPLDEDEGGYEESPVGGQAEVSIAVDSTGNHIVIGFNDTRGFSVSPTDVSGFMYSDNGGVSFTDGGQLPHTTGHGENGATSQIFGDPEVKYAGGSNFLYFSILVSTSGIQTMCVHRSTDNGHTWQGPFEITAATRPHGVVGEAADKEFADIDPDTGRVMMSWTNFGTAVEIRATFSDNVFSANPPTWSTSNILSATSVDGQSSIPRFAGSASANVYVAWRRFTTSFNGAGSGAGGRNTGFASSPNNGVSFNAAINTRASDFFEMDQVLGNDRVNTSPSLAVDNSGGTYNGTVHLVYADNLNSDGADVAYQRSTDGGATWSGYLLLNSRPGLDRPQWFPWVTVDNSTGRVYVMYYDQQIASDGDLMEAQYQYSDDGGTTWTKPAPLSDRPFHAGMGNDTGQPNLGDYIQAVAQNGELFAAFAYTTQAFYTDGEPGSGNLNTPDVFFRRISVRPASLSLGKVTYTDSGSNGYIDAGEHALLTIPLNNYVTNGINASTITGISAVLGTSQTGVSIASGSSTYPNIAAGGSATNNSFFDVFVDASTFTVGSEIQLTLTVSSSEGTAVLPFTLHSGTPVGTSLLTQDFNGVSPGTLPAGWTTSHSGGANIVPWTTSNLMMGTGSNAAFHQNLNDSSTTNQTRFERLFSPAFNIPATSRFVTVDFDTHYRTEDDAYSYGGPSYKVQAFDGYLLRIFDGTPSHLPARSVQVESFENELYTGTKQHFPKHFPRNSSSAYFQDMSAWAGDSVTDLHVYMRLLGMQQASPVQLRFEYTQDSGGTCASLGYATPCGVAFDNLLVRSWVLITQTALTVGSPTGQYSDQVTLTAQVSPATTSDGTATGNVDFTVDGNYVGTAAINGSGLASLNYTITQSAGPYAIGASFTSTNAAFTNSTGTGTLTVTKEDAVVTPDPTNTPFVGMNTLTSGPITLKATLTDSPDGFAGNICLATPVIISLNPIYSGASYQLTASTSCSTPSGPTTDPSANPPITAATLTATATFNNVAQNVYLVTFAVGGTNNYYVGSAQSLLTVSRTTELQLATGGGRFSRGSIPAEFGFYARHTTTGIGVFQMAYLEHRVDGDFLMKSNVLANAPGIFAGTPKTAQVYANITYPASLNNDRLQLNVQDGSPDKYKQRISLPPTFTTIVPGITFDYITPTAGNIVIIP